jgi:hypothetical protein
MKMRFVCPLWVGIAHELALIYTAGTFDVPVVQSFMKIGVDLKILNLQK